MLIMIFLVHYKQHYFKGMRQIQVIQ